MSEQAKAVADLLITHDNAKEVLRPQINTLRDAMDKLKRVNDEFEAAASILAKAEPRATDAQQAMLYAGFVERRDNAEERIERIYAELGRAVLEYLVVKP